MSSTQRAQRSAAHTYPGVFAFARGDPFLQELTVSSDGGTMGSRLGTCTGGSGDGSASSSMSVGPWTSSSLRRGRGPGGEPGLPSLWAWGSQTQTPRGLRRGRQRSEGNKLLGWCDRPSSRGGKGCSLRGLRPPGAALCAFCGNLGYRRLCSRVHSSPSLSDLCRLPSLGPQDSDGDPVRGHCPSLAASKNTVIRRGMDPKSVTLDISHWEGDTPSL